MPSQAFLTSTEWGRLYALAWSDPAFKDLLEKDPRAAIKQASEKLGHSADALVSVPPRPADLSAEQLEEIISGKEMLFLASPNSC